MKERIIKTIKDSCPTVDFDSAVALIDDGVINSLDLIQLITELTQAFSIEIDSDDIVPENFNSVDAIVKMVMSKLA